MASKVNDRNMQVQQQYESARVVSKRRQTREPAQDQLPWQPEHRLFIYAA